MGGLCPPSLCPVPSRNLPGFLEGKHLGSSQDLSQGLSPHRCEVDPQILPPPLQGPLDSGEHLLSPGIRTGTRPPEECGYLSLLAISAFLYLFLPLVVPGSGDFRFPL